MARDREAGTSAPYHHWGTLLLVAQPRRAARRDDARQHLVERRRQRREVMVIDVVHKHRGEAPRVRLQVPADRQRVPLAPRRRGGAGAAVPGSPAAASCGGGSTRVHPPLPIRLPSSSLPPPLWS